ncbi:MAG: hypothetical protein NTX95_00905 [Actinobacteria bacterium]|nr:hypothetical protein [Actinomycetota bacterium]
MSDARRRQLRFSDGRIESVDRAGEVVHAPIFGEGTVSKSRILHLLRLPVIRLIRPFIQHQQAANVAILDAVIDIGKNMHVFETDLDADARDRAELLAEIRKMRCRIDDLETRVTASHTIDAPTDDVR